MIMEETSKNLSAAYQVLSNTDNEPEYDRSIGIYGSGHSANGLAKYGLMVAAVLDHQQQERRHMLHGDQYDVHMWNAYHVEKRTIQMLHKNPS